MINLYEVVRLFEDEEMVGCFRGHPMPLFKPLILPIVGLFAIFLFMFPLFYMGAWGVGLFLLLLFIDFLWMARVVIRWYGSFYVVTTTRLFCITRRGFFKRKVDEIALGSVQGLSYETRGLGQMLFRLGTIQIAMEGEGTPREFAHLARPQLVMDLISRQMHKVQDRGMQPQEMEYEVTPTFRAL